MSDNNDYTPDQHSRRVFMGRSAAIVGTGLLGSSLLAACGSDSSSSTTATGSATTASTQPGKGKTIGVILNGVNEYIQGAGTGVLQAVVPAGYAVKVLQSGFKPDLEVQNFQSLIGQGVDGIVVLPVSADSAARGAIQANQKGIPTVDLAWATPSPADKVYVGRVYLNNKNGGQLIADWLASNAKPGGILLVQGLPGNEFSDAFDAGLQAALKPGFTIVGKQPGNYIRTDAATAAQNLITAHPDAKIIVSAAAEMGVGVASYLQRAGKKDYTSVTSDGNKDMLLWMKRGYIQADNYFSSARSGVLGGTMLRKYLETKQKTALVNLGSSIQTPDTIVSAVAKDPLSYPQYLPQVAAAS